METIISICGLECTACPAYIAKQTDDNALREKTAKEWSEAFKTELKPEDINCDSCIAVDGAHIGYCNVCEIRQCGLAKKVVNCAYCDEYVCDKLEKWFENVPDAQKRLNDIREKNTKK
jgi:hypothetical protein